MVEQAVRGGWKIPDSLLDLLPKRVSLVALGIGADGQPRKYADRDRLRACEVLIKMLRQNAGIEGPGGRRRDGTTVNTQVNVGVGGRAGPPWIVSTQEEVAAFFGRSLETIKDWRAKGMPGVPGGPDQPGAYDLREILAWRDANIGSSGRAGDDPVAGLPGGPPDGETSRTEADRRRAVAVAEREELRVRRMRGELLDLGDATREAVHQNTHARALFEQIPDRLLGLLPTASTGDDKRRFRHEAHKAIDGVIEALHGALKDRAEQGACGPKESDHEDAEGTVAI